MALIRALSSAGGGGSGILKDIIRDKVLNGGYTSYTLTPNTSGRCTLNEGGVVDDTTNKIVYVYLDVTINSSGSSSDYWKLYTTNIPKGRLPLTNGSSARSRETLIADSSNPKPLCLVYDSTVYIDLGYGIGMSPNDRIISYGAWSYTE